MQDASITMDFMSYLTEVRGLKFVLPVDASREHFVVPHGGTWIEIE